MLYKEVSFDAITQVESFMNLLECHLQLCFYLGLRYSIALSFFAPLQILKIKIVAS